MKNILYIIISAIFILILADAGLRSQEQYRIYHQYIDNDTIDMGITYRDTNDVFFPLRTNFIFENNSDTELFVRDEDPTFAKFSAASSTEGTDLTFEFFSHSHNNFPLVLNTNNKRDTISLQYLREGLPFNIDRIEERDRCKYFLGFEDRDNNVVLRDTFIIIARSTDKYIGTYEDSVDFDSVYIGNDFEMRKHWYIKNVWQTKQKIFKDEFELKTSDLNEEIFVQRLEEDLTLAPQQSPIKWNIDYVPKDTIPDTAQYSMFFRPYEFEDGGDDEIIDTVNTQITGVGVIQKVELYPISDHNYSNQSGEHIIDIGSFRPNEKDTIKFRLTNTGNFPLGYRSESFINERNDEFKVLDSFISDSAANLKFNQFDTVAIEFTAGSGGNINATYRFESDLLQRGISGAQPVNSYIDVKLRGEVRQSRISVSTDTVDLGVVTISELADCQDFSSTLREIRNTGSDELEILHIELTNNVDFSYTIDKTSLAQNEKADLNITFEPENSGDLSSELLIVPNTSNPPDTIKIPLKGTGVPQTKMNIAIDSIKAFPGSQILVPIIVEKEKIVNAEEYTDELYYNTSILEFVEPIFANTASEPSSIESEFEINGNGNLEIKLRRPNGSFFAESDTLVLLKFNTYLGNDDHTYLNFSAPMFSNENCSQIFDIQPKRGIFIIDSVCGIDFKTYEIDRGVDIISVSPNPAENDLNIQIQTPVDIVTDFKIIDMLGNVHLKRENLDLLEGINLKRFNINDLPNGIYTIKISSGRFIRTKSLVISK